jgi:acetyl-CoA carboxylase biotin carboxyl carrier protein
MTNEIEMTAETIDGRIRLLSPSVGLFTNAAPRSRVLTPGTPAGALETLGVTRSLITPPGVMGRIVSDRPDRVFEAVGFGTVLFELAPVEGGDAEFETAETAAATGDGLTFPAPYSGRFWHRPSPSDPAFVKDGDEVTDGQTIGLIEVMKTFTHLHYSSAGGLPTRARIAKIFIADGGEVNAGEAILELKEE